MLIILGLYSVLLWLVFAKLKLIKWRWGHLDGQRRLRPEYQGTGQARTMSENNRPIRFNCLVGS